MTPEQMSSEQLEKFLAYYRKRIDEEPRNVEARLRLATVYREMDKTPRAVDQYEEAAQILDDEGLAREAIEACKAILELDPDQVEARYLLARLYAQTPDATDGSARVAEPVGDAEELYELTDEADPRREELIETDEFRPEDEEGEPLSRPDPAEIDRENERDEGDATRVADYGESPGEFSADRGSDDESEHEKRTVELTPEELERRDGFSREEMEELLTTIDVDSEDIVEVEDFEEYQLDDESQPESDGRGTVDLELGADLEVEDPDERDT